MAAASGLQDQALATIAHRCADETERFFRRLSHDSRFCFELFRRAFVARVQDAWDLIYSQYRPLVSSWVERHAAYAASGEEADYFINRAFEKMWLALSPERFGGFPDLKSLLRYLQMCVHSAVYDVVRKTGREVAEIDIDAQMETSPFPQDDDVIDVEREALERTVGDELWAEISARLRTDKERRAVYGSFVLGLKPREVYALFHDVFRDVNDVYRAKENVLARLRRDEDLAQLLAKNAR